MLDDTVGDVVGDLMLLTVMRAEVVIRVLPLIFAVGLMNELTESDTVPVILGEADSEIAALCDSVRDVKALCVSRGLALVVALRVE